MASIPVSSATHADPAPAPFFAFANVSESFGDNCVLDNVSFDVRRGETLCILGRSGVGKSVSLRLFMGFLKPDRGRVIAAGDDITDWGEARLTELRRKITMVFQSGALFDSLTVEENIAFPLQREKGRTDAEVEKIVGGLLNMLEIGRLREEYPASLSTGMKRAVAIARSLAAEPQGILYDEPTTMVDPLMVHTIADLMQKVKRQVRLTSIVVTHDTRLARQLADRLVFLHAGRARFFGTVAEMDASPDEILRSFLEQDQAALPAETLG